LVQPTSTFIVHVGCKGYPEDLEGYQPFLPNSPEGSPKGVVNHEVASEVGSTHSLEGFQIVSDSLEAFRLPINPTLSVLRNPHIPRVNSSREIVIVDDTEVPTRPNAGSGVEDPLFQSESFRTPAHTVGTSNFGSIPLTVHDLYGNLGVSLDQPMASQMPETSVTYTVPLDHFTGTTSSVTTVSDQLLVGSHLILPLQMAHSMVPQATTILPKMWLLPKLQLEHHFHLDQIHHFLLGIEL
jgi:hypothetical protein